MPPTQEPPMNQTATSTRNWDTLDDPFLTHSPTSNRRQATPYADATSHCAAPARPDSQLSYAPMEVDPPATPRCHEEDHQLQTAPAPSMRRRDEGPLGDTVPRMREPTTNPRPEARHHEDCTELSDRGGPVHPAQTDELHYKPAEADHRANDSFQH